MSHMDLHSNEIAWVGNIYRRFEAVCQEINDIRIQENARYIENQVRTGYDRVRNFCAGFMEDFLLPSICGCEGFISETYLMHDSDFDNCEESEIGSHTEMTLTPAELDESVSLGKGSSPVTLPNGPYHDVNQGEDCSAPLRKSDAISEEVTRCDCLKKEKEIRKYNHSDACFAASSAYRCASDRVTDDTAITERSNDLESGEASMSTNLFGTRSIEEEEEFENVKPKNCLDPEAENNEVCFLPFQERKNRLNKKMLRRVFASKMRSAKKQDHEKLEIQPLHVNVKTKKNEEISMSSAYKEELISNKFPAHVIFESEWVLL